MRKVLNLYFINLAFQQHSVQKTTTTMITTVSLMTMMTMMSPPRKVLHSREYTQLRARDKICTFLQ